MEWAEMIEEPEWLADDLDAHLTWQYEQSLLCSCGHPIDVSTDHDTRTAWAAERVVCWACAARERTSEGDRSDGKRPAPGTKYRVRNRLKDGEQPRG